MSLQDLTPQLRTRLSRLERLVGWVVTVSTLLLLFGLGYYVYELARNRGWFLTKMPYFTFVHSAAGLNVGERVRLMGFDAGEITAIEPQKPEDLYFNVYVQFHIKEPYYGYLWENSRAKVGAADFLGHRFIEVTKGSNAPPTYPLHEVREVSLAEAQSFAGSNDVYFSQDIIEHANVIVSTTNLVTADALKTLAALKLNSIQIINKNVAVQPPK